MLKKTENIPSTEGRLKFLQDKTKNTDNETKAGRLINHKDQHQEKMCYSPLF